MAAPSSTPCPMACLTPTLNPGWFYMYKPTGQSIEGGRDNQKILSVDNKFPFQRIDQLARK